MNIKKMLSLALVLAMALTVIPAFGLTAAAAEDGLIAHYNFADGAKDATGNFDGIVNGNNLVFDPNGFVTYPGGYGTTSSFISLPGELLKDLTDFTVSMWIKQNTSGYDEKNGIVFWDFSNDNNYDRVFWQQGEKISNTYGSGNIMICNRGTNNSTSYRATERGTSSAMRGNWALLTATFDFKNGIVNAYVNGEAIKLSHSDNTWGADQVPSKIYDRAKETNGVKNMQLYLGHNTWADAGEAVNNPDLKGSMADVRIYNKALTAEEVKALLSTKKTMTVSYMAGEVELQKQVVEYFSDEASFTVPETVDYNGIPYNLKDGVTDRTATGDTAVVEYEKTAAKATDIKPVAGVTYIEGNEAPLPQKVTLETDQPDVTLDVDVTWDKTPLENAEYGEPVKVTGTLDSEYASVGKPEVSVTKLQCDDDALANETITATEGQAGNGASAKMFNPVKGKVVFEFDARFNALGNSTITIAQKGSKTLNGNDNYPIFGGTGDAVSIQVNSEGLNVRTWDGSNGTTVIEKTVTAGNTYHFLISTDTAAQTYDVEIRDETGKVLQNKEGITYRSQLEDYQLDTLVVLDNGSTENAIDVSNFRISWTEGYTEYTIKAQCDDKDIEGFESYTKKFLDKAAAEKAAVPAINNYAVSGAPVVDDAAKTVTFSYISVKTADVFGYTFLSNEPGVEGSDGYSCGRTSWGGRNVVFITFDAPTVESDKVLASAALNVYFPYVNNKASNETYNINVYRIDPTKVDANGLVADEYTIDNWKEKLGAVRVGGVTDSHPSEKNFNSYIVDLHECTGEKIVLAMDFSRDISVAGASYANGAYKPYIVDEKIVTPPQVPALTAALGWNEDAFTIDYTASDVTAVENAVYGATVVSSDGKTISGTFTPGEDGGIGLTTPNTNLTYVATPTVEFEGAVFKGEPTEKEAIYSLVMDAIANATIEGQINADQLAAVNTVLANGGIFVDKNGNLTDEAQKVMTKTDKTITLKPEAVALGLEFSVDENAMTYAVKGDDGNITTPADAIDVTATTITIKDAASAEAVMLALEAVNLEFVSTEMADAAAEDADAAQDFIPEL